MLEFNEIKRKPNTTSSAGSAAARVYADTCETAQCEPTAQQLAPSVSRSGINPPVLTPPPNEAKILQSKLPVITGEAQYKGMLNLDGMVTGQLGGGGSLNVRQRSRSFFNEPEFSGEISFRDMIRVNGHIAGSVCSRKGTLIVDSGARVDAIIDVAVAVISGIVNGDIVAHERVEIGPNAKIYGNIWTRSIEIKHGAIFEGICTMIAEEQVAG